MSLHSIIFAAIFVMDGPLSPVKWTIILYGPKYQTSACVMTSNFQN